MRPMKTVAERLHFLRKRAKIRSKRAAAAVYGIGYEIYKKIEVHNAQDPRNLTPEQAQIIAKHHRVSSGWLLFGEGHMEGYVSVRLAGDIGAGQEVIVFERDDHNEVVSGEIGRDEGRAFRVTGDSMLPLARHNDLIFVGPDRKDVTSLIGLECAVHLEDGRTFFKILRNGSRKGRFNLESYNAETITNVAIHSAGPFIGLRRGGTTSGRSRR